jgi:YcxB-like protein
VQLTFTLSFAEYRRAHDLYFRAGGFRKRLNYLVTTRFAPWAAVFFLAAGIALLLRSTPGHRAAPGVATLLLAAMLGHSAWRFHSLLRQLYRKLPMPFETTLTDYGISDRHHPTVPWSSVQGTLESPELVLILLGPARFLPLPRRIFSSEQLQQLGTYLESAGKSKAA